MQNVLKVQNVSSVPAVERELMLLKVNTTSSTRTEILEIANVFRAKIVDFAEESLTLEVFSEIFGNPSTGLLYEEFVKNKKLATSAASYYYPDGFGHTSFTISIIPMTDGRAVKKITGLISSIPLGKIGFNLDSLA